jgi:hypothetical protein
MNEVTDDHDPEFEPYASFGRERLGELMDQAFRAGDARKWTMLAEFLEEKMTTEELTLGIIAKRTFIAIVEEIGLPSPEQLGSIIGMCCDLAVAAVDDESRRKGGVVA